MQTATIEQQRYPKPSGSAGAIPRAHQRGYRNALLLGAGGLLAGALTWNAVAIWRALDPAQDPAVQMTAVAPESRVALPTIYLVDQENCTALVLDRKTNHTEMQPCPQNGLALRLDAHSEREGLAIIGEPKLTSAR